MTSAFTYISHPNTYEIYLKDNVDFSERNSGAVELAIAHLISYLTTYFPKFKQSPTSPGTEVLFTFGYPQDLSLESSVPVVAVSSRDDEHYQDSAGYIQYYDIDTGDIAYGVQFRPTIEFDIWARNTREKKFIQGVLANMLHAGIVNGLLRQRGIQVVDFVRSIPRGYDQADRVLQFHTHQIGSDELFRQVMEFDIIFDHRLIWDFETPNTEVAYAVKQILLNVNEGGEQTSYYNVKGLPTTVTIA